MKGELKKILEKVDPKFEIFTEAVQNEFVNLIENKIDLAKQTAFEVGNERLLEQDADHSSKLTALVEALDADHAQKLENLVEAIDADHSAKLENLMEAVDSDHAEKLQGLVEAIDTDHTGKLETMIEVIDADHTAKLKAVISRYETETEDRIVEGVSDYLDTYIEEAIPSNDLADLAKLQRLEEAYTQIRKIVAVSDDFIQDEVKEAIIDAKMQIDEKQGTIDKLLAEKIAMRKEFRQFEAHQVLEEKTKDMPAKKRAYVRKFLKEASNTDEVMEMLDEANAAYDDGQREDRELLIESNRDKGTEITVPVAPDEEELLKEAEKAPSNNESSPVMHSYVSAINRSANARK